MTFDLEMEKDFSRQHILRFTGSWGEKRSLMSVIALLVLVFYSQNERSESSTSQQSVD